MQEALRLLAELESSTTDWILSAGSERTIARGELIAVEGQELGALVFVLDGLFAVRLTGCDGDPLALLGSGELVGEISFVENLPATANVVACEDSRVFWVARADLERHLEADSTFAVDLYRALARVLSRRLRERSRALAARIGDRSTGDPLATPAWAALVATLDAFKDLLQRAAAASEHGDLDVPQPLVEEIERKFDELFRGLTQLTREVTNAEILIEVQSALRREFSPYLHLTQFARRVLVKPRGYAGDFLTIDWMYRNEPGGVAPLGPLIDRLFLERPTVRAARSRRGLLAEEIALALARGGGSVRVTSLACGPAAEFFDVFKENPGVKLQATLVDIDFQALAFVEERRNAAGLTKRMRLEHANLVYLATGRSTLDLKDQNLVYSIGLIDYFEDQFVIALLNWIHGCLAPGGKVILGNFHPRNPDRAFMDLILDWKLIHRTEEDMNRLFNASTFRRPCTEIRFEREGINMFASCVRA
jgi:extracellular factor (EF) 3-hydroxypalmitic acid methyl ester biosynthesis protein